MERELLLKLRNAHSLLHPLTANGRPMRPREIFRPWFWGWGGPGVSQAGAERDETMPHETEAARGLRDSLAQLAPPRSPLVYASWSPRPSAWPQERSPSGASFSAQSHRPAQVEVRLLHAGSRRKHNVTRHAALERGANDGPRTRQVSRTFTLLSDRDPLAAS